MATKRKKRTSRKSEERKHGAIIHRNFTGEVDYDNGEIGVESWPDRPAGEVTLRCFSGRSGSAFRIRFDAATAERLGAEIVMHARIAHDDMRLRLAEIEMMLVELRAKMEPPLTGTPEEVEAAKN